MDWGMQNRLARIIKPETGRTLMLAVDHGYFLGPTTGLENCGETIKPLLPYADSIMLNRGILRIQVDPTTQTPVVLRVSGGTSVLKELSDEGVTVTMKDAVRMNASAVAISIFVGAENEKQTLMNLSELINEGQEYGMPVLAVTAVGKDMARDARYLSLATRIGAELGANFVKTYYCDGFERVVSCSPVPVVIAGGKKIPEKDALEMAYKALSDGAVGVDMGRNIFQSEDPVAMIKAVRALIHEGISSSQAYKMYQDLKKEAKAKSSAPKKSAKTKSAKKKKKSAA